MKRLFSINFGMKGIIYEIPNAVKQKNPTYNTDKSFNGTQIVIHRY